MYLPYIIFQYHVICGLLSHVSFTRYDDVPGTSRVFFLHTTVCIVASRVFEAKPLPGSWTLHHLGHWNTVFSRCAETLLGDLSAGEYINFPLRRHIPRMQGAWSVSSQNTFDCRISPLQQSLFVKPASSPAEEHPVPPHWVQPVGQQTPSPSLPTVPSLQVSPAP